uniref:SPRY-associated domain-containing protein n=1 Tax=Hucho hucho TaxID=62062 RepID=A0A4W5K1B1_9TELE
SHDDLFVRLSGCGVTEKGCASLVSALRSNPSHLRELDLSNNDLKDSGVKLLSAVLGNPHCKLETLRLSGCGVTEKGCASLVSALESNPSHLRELDLSNNDLKDSGVKLLSAVLGNPHCKLETLRSVFLLLVHQIHMCLPGTHSPNHMCLDSEAYSFTCGAMLQHFGSEI